MVGRASSTFGLIIAAISMILIGYYLTLDVYRDMGSYIIFYEGRYYGGIACMAVGGILFFIGALLPIVWPKETKPKAKPLQAETKGLAYPTHEADVPKSPVKQVDSIPLLFRSKIRALSMQSTCGSECIKILKVLANSDAKGITISKIAENTGIDKARMKKALNLLLNLELIEKRHADYDEAYILKEDLKQYVSNSL